MNGTETMTWQGRMQVVSTALCLSHFVLNIEGSHGHDLLLTELVSDFLIYALLGTSFQCFGVILNWHQ